MKKLQLVVWTCALLTACTWHNEEELYPDEGGPGTFCDGSSAITYTATIQPILNARCMSCHSQSAAANLGGSVRLDSHAAVKQRADNGSLLGVINHDPGYPQMPQGSSKLSDCQISLIAQWIENGAPNN